ncbi:hypothetical protein N7530_010551 [Penicillium desertorum]|uniref:Uncharacterized protein n=1 Tax=Penicillium desertorum TaxID=1303715 RepID=A0A9W9WHS7_9EURO|nr:hypothetical protein N7530_010551 [Penicillium desertorum]
MIRYSEINSSLLRHGIYVDNALIEDNRKRPSGYALIALRGRRSKEESHLSRHQLLLRRFAIYRGSLGFAGESVELGATHELGYMSLAVDMLENLSSDVRIAHKRALGIVLPSDASAGELVTPNAALQRETPAVRAAPGSALSY